MSLINNLKKQVDLPVWEWARFAPTNTAALTSAVGDWNQYYVGGTARYAYYIVSNTAFYRYDTQTDSWESLALNNLAAPAYDLSLTYNPVHGYYGKVISPGPSNNTIQLAGLTGNSLAGNKILIIGGAGAGQERNIVSVSEPTVHDSGFVTAASALAASPAYITDGTTGFTAKTWKFNQWADYQMRITQGATGTNVTRRIIYNNNTQLFYGDNTFATLYRCYFAPIPVALTANSAFYQIESSIATVDVPWEVPLDMTSRFVVKSGAVWAIGGSAAAPYYQVGYYSVLEDAWYYKGSHSYTAYAGVWTNLENAVEAIGECEGGGTTGLHAAWVTPLTSGTCTSVAAAPYDKRTLIDSSQNMNVNKYANQMIRIYGGTGIGQARAIIANTRTTFIIGRDWDVTPDSTSTYQVIGDSDKLYYLAGGNQSTMTQYTNEYDMMTSGRQFDFGVSRSYYVDYNPKSIAPVIVGGVPTLMITTAGGASGGGTGSYAVGDILTLTNNGLYYGMNGTAKVTQVTSGTVTQVSLLTAGTNYPAHATAYATTSDNSGGGNGTGCTLVVASNTLPAQPPIGATGIAQTTGGLLAVTAIAAAGTGYMVGDLLTITAKTGVVRVTGVNSVGGLTSVTIEAQGSGQTSTTYGLTNTTVHGIATDTVSLPARAVASGGQVTVTVTDVATVTTGQIHNFSIGDTVYVGGSDMGMTTTSHTWYGGLRVIAGVPSSTTFSYSMPSQSTASQVPQVTVAISATAVSSVVVTTPWVSGSYAVGDVLTLTGGVAKARVTAINPVAGGNQVLAVALIANGTGYTAGATATTSGNEGGGTGAGCTLTTQVVAAGMPTLGVATIPNAGQGFGVVTGLNSSRPSSPTYTVGTGLAGISVYNGGYNYCIGDILQVAGGAGGTVKVTATTLPNAGTGIVRSVAINIGGSGGAYAVNDILTLTTTGSACTVTVTAVQNGLVTAVNLTTAGTGYTNGLSSATTSGNQGGGNGTGCTIVVQTIGQGAIMAVQLMSPGQGYTASTTQATTHMGSTGIANTRTGSNLGTGCTIRIDSIGTVISAVAAGNNNLWLNITSVNSATGAIAGASFLPYLGGVNFCASTYTAVTIAITPQSASAAIYNAEIMSTSYLMDLTKNWQPNEHVGKLILVTTPGGAQTTANLRRILANSSNSIWVQPVLGAIPVSGTYKYVIYDPKPLGAECSVKGGDVRLYPWGVATSGATNTLVDAPTGLATVAITAGGTGHVVGDVLTFTNNGGTLGKATVTGVTSGAVTSATVLNQGTGYVANSIYAQSATTGIGTGCSIVCTATNAKNWVTNQWAGRKVKIVSGTGVNAFPNEFVIGSNTATTLTLATNWQFPIAPDATTVYSIMDNWGVCTAGGILTGVASVGAAGTGYSVGDVCWVSATLLGTFVKILTISGTGVVTYLIINPGSAATNASYATADLSSGGVGSGAGILAPSGFTVACNATFTVAGGAGIYNDPFQYFGAGAASGSLVTKRVRPLAGLTTIATGADYALTSVVSPTGITGAGVTPDGLTQYAVMGVLSRSPAASTGVSSFMRLFGTTVLEPARYFISFRGGGFPDIDRFDLVQNVWDFMMPTPVTEGYSLGSMFEYNGKDRIYFTKDATGRIMYFDLSTNDIVTSSTVPYGMSTAIPGNRMFTMSTPELIAQGMEYLYVMRHTGAEMWRVLIYW